ncbi:hypothetical protein MCHI_001823 [Candidatus Magnetoovum chiemensis]|nr:hypothetical protein MCHI_001823 [Candidatus Magnetoovum chiemensis]
MSNVPSAIIEQIFFEIGRAPIGVSVIPKAFATSAPSDVLPL